VIRQAISCDVCGAEKRQTNHWFVACEVAGELRLAGFASRMRQRAGAKHLCGQTCLHKLVDEYIARSISGRTAALPAEPAESAPPRSEVDASLTSPAAYIETDITARLIGPVVPPPPQTPRASASPVLVPLQPHLVTESPLPGATPADDAPNYSSRRWRAEAWERERNRELHAVERHPEIARRRKGL
jgi:hypothetical protein